MSSNQTLIMDAIDARIIALATGRTKLKYSYDLEKNSKRGESGSYGYGAGAASTTDGTFKAVTLDQEFFVVLTNNYSNRSGDSGEVAALKEIYDDIEVVYRDFVSSKLGINSVVLLVGDLALDEPEKISENTISVRANFSVKHRKLLI